MSIVLGILTFLLIVVSLFIVLVVLAQKSKDGGMGSALGGGAVEATFGHEASNVLTRSTIYAAIIFFVLTFALYLGRIYESKHTAGTAGALPTIAVPAAAPSSTAPVSTAPGVTLPTTTANPASGATAPASTTPAAATPPAPEAPKKQP